MSNPPRPVGVITGLASESRVVGHLVIALGTDHPAPLVHCAGARPDRAERLAQQLAEEGAAALLSFGIAGGLHPDLAPGTLVISESLVSLGGADHACDSAWRARLQSGAAGRLTACRFAGSRGVVRSRQDKAALHRDSGAQVVDMESHRVAAVAAERGLPFLALRAVADPANSSLPHSVIGSIAEDGRPREARVAARLALRPWELPAVARLQRDAKAAHRALRSLTDLAPLLFGGF